MAPDHELVLIFALLHLVALVCGGVLFAMFMRSGPRPNSPGADEEDDGGGGGGNDRLGGTPKTSPSGGIPLPDAEQSPIRLRTGERLGDLVPRRERRPVEHPEPVRRRLPVR